MVNESTGALYIIKPATDAQLILGYLQQRIVQGVKEHGLSTRTGIRSLLITVKVSLGLLEYILEL